MNKIWLPVVFFVSFLNVQGQKNFPAEEVLKDKLQKYCASVPWEEIYVHSDRSEYIAGEDMWLKVYLFDRQKYQLSEYNSIAYFELLNANNLQVLKKRIYLEKGLGPAHILIPDTLSTGRYTMRAYTNWMKNFLPENCFTLEVKIYNVLNDHSGNGKQWDSIAASYPVNESIQARNDQGVKMTVNNHNPDKLDILIESDESYLKTNKNNCILLIQTHGNVGVTKNIILETQPVNLSIPKGVLLPGINQLVLFNDDLEPICERFIYTPLKESPAISVDCSDSLKTREKVNIKVDFSKTEPESGDMSDVSISVAPAEEGLFIPDIDEYLIFGTEFGVLPGSLINKHLRDISPEACDSFLVNAKSRWINWNKVISGQLPVLNYEKETDSHYLTGRLVNKNTNATEPGKNLFLSKPGRTATFQCSRTDSAGYFRFSLPVTDEVMDLVIQPEDGDINSSIMISPPFNEDFAQREVKYDTIKTGPKDYIRNMGINYQVNKIYGLSSVGESLNPSFTLTQQKRFYGKPDIELKMDDYIKLPVMEEVFFELTPGAQLKKKKSTYTMTIYDPVSKIPYEKPPVVFIDGVVIKDIGEVAAMDPENVEKIDIVKDLYLVGDYIFFGIVNILTRKGDCRNLTLPDYAIRTNYTIIDPVESFTSPDYSGVENKKSRIPDFRNTLYWNPMVKSDKNVITSVEFWTSDGVGSFEICLQGVNRKGIPVSIRKTFNVR
jgi:hypothetical protein